MTLDFQSGRRVEQAGIGRDHRRNIHLRACEDINPLMSVTQPERVAPQESDDACRREDKRSSSAATAGGDDHRAPAIWRGEPGKQVRGAGAARPLANKNVDGSRKQLQPP